jgi:hypothetical protein
VQAYNLGETSLLKWDASGTSDHTARWEFIDGVRTPVMVCPKHFKQKLRKVIDPKAWRRKTTSLIGTPRLVLACDDVNYTSATLPRLALVGPFLGFALCLVSLVHLLLPT